MRIARLGPADAAAIVACFERVYGDSYANRDFYDADCLGSRIAAGQLRSVGAFVGSTLVGHMAMSLASDAVPPAASPELGNTVVDPQARGGGVAWQVGAELTKWCSELGYHGFLHYPTTDHYIMQRQSVQRGFETGVMLGYIPAATHGGVGEKALRGRQTCTIVYEPLVKPATLAALAAPVCYLPGYAEPLIRGLAVGIGLPRTWQPATAVTAAASQAQRTDDPVRGLSRLTISQVGADIADWLETARPELPCEQLDLSLADPGIDAGTQAALAAGYTFCGWLPGFATDDVLRLQRVDPAVTDLAPELLNPMAQEILGFALRAS